MIALSFGCVWVGPMCVGMFVDGFKVSYMLHLLILGSCYTAHKRNVNNESVHQNEQHIIGINTIP